MRSNGKAGLLPLSISLANEGRKRILGHCGQAQVLAQIRRTGPHLIHRESVGPLLSISMILKKQTRLEDNSSQRCWRFAPSLDIRGDYYFHTRDQQSVLHAMKDRFALLKIPYDVKPRAIRADGERQQLPAVAAWFTAEGVEVGSSVRFWTYQQRSGWLVPRFPSDDRLCERSLYVHFMRHERETLDVFDYIKANSTPPER